MKAAMNYRMLIFFFISILVLPSHAKDINKSEFLKISNPMLLKPCTIPAYLSCIRKKPVTCKKAVKRSFKSCEQLVPTTIVRKDVSTVINNYGSCMTKELLRRLKMKPALLTKCEPVLKAHIKNSRTKK